MNTVATCLLALSLSLSSVHAAGTNETKEIYRDTFSVQLENVSLRGTRTNLWFDCDVNILNNSSAPLTASNVFTRSPGLALKVMDSNGYELTRGYAWPLHASHFTFEPGKIEHFGLIYGRKPGDGGVSTISVPHDAKMVNVQIDGMLPGSRYFRCVTSNVVSISIPKQ